MNLVRLQYGGGSSIEPYTVIVSLDEEFKGQPVTLTQGTEIMRKTCPTTAPYEVEFKPMNDGVWVASSTTKDGNVVSVDTEPLLEWGTYNVTLESGFNFREWLNRGRVEKTFTSLDDVLADQPTVRQLMTIHASCDYLYESYLTDNTILDTIMNSTYGAKWLGLRDYVCDKFMANETAKFTMLNSDNWEYILKDRVPIMTAVNAPYGNAFGSAIQTNFPLYNAFDNNSATYYAPSSTASGTYLGYEFTNPTCIQKFRIVQYSEIRCTLIQLCGSNISSNLADMTNIGNAQVVDTFDKTLTIENTQYYKYYCVKFVTVSDRPVISTLQFYGRSLNVSVPTMTSNTEPWGVVTATDYYKDVSVSYDPWRAFTNGTERGWLPANFNDELVYDFGYPVLVKKMTLRNAKQASTETSKVYYDLFGSIDGQKYDLIQNDVNCYTHRNDLFTYSIDTNKYRFYKLVCTKNDNGRATSGYGCILQLYGLDYSEREFEEGSTIKYLYDHGVELEEISLGSDATKQVDSILLSCTGDNNNACAYVQKTLTENLFRTTIRNAKILKSSYLIIASNPLNVVTPDAYSNLVQENAPNNFGLDVSNFKNSNKYIGVRTQETSGAMLEILELWLE